MTSTQSAPSLKQFEKRAQQHIRHPQAWDYLQDSAGSGRTHQANLQAFAEQRLVPRPLVNVGGGHTRLELFGQSFEHPILLAPIAYQMLFHAHGEQASAAAASAQGSALVVSSLASQTLEQIAAASDTPPWFQIYWQGSRERTSRLIDRALAAGYHTFMVTVDAPVKQAHFELPPEICAVNLEVPAAPAARLPHQSEVFDGWMRQAPTWEDMAWLRDTLNKPLLIKGILHRDDALRAQKLGFDGLVVSNHGGRVLDGCIDSLSALRDIRSALNNELPILFDSGIRSGQDVYHALANGADAVLLGRPYIYGLAANGALGVAQVIRLLRDELEMTMALMGKRTLDAITGSES